MREASDEAIRAAISRRRTATTQELKAAEKNATGNVREAGVYCAALICEQLYARDLATAKRQSKSEQLDATPTTCNLATLRRSWNAGHVQLAAREAANERLIPQLWAELQRMVTAPPASRAGIEVITGYGLKAAIRECEAAEQHRA